MDKQIKQVEMDIKNISKGAEEDDKFPAVMKISFVVHHLFLFSFGEVRIQHNSACAG